MNGLSPPPRAPQGPPLPRTPVRTPVMTPRTNNGSSSYYGSAPTTPRALVNSAHAAPSAAGAEKDIATLLPSTNGASAVGASSPLRQQQQQQQSPPVNIGIGNRTTTVGGDQNPYASSTVVTAAELQKEAKRIEKMNKKMERKNENNKPKGWCAVATTVSVLVAGASVAVSGIVAMDQVEKSYRDDACDARVAAIPQTNQWYLLQKEQTVHQRLKLEEKVTFGALTREERDALILPKGRMGHASCVVGGIMYIHGGLHGIPPPPQKKKKNDGGDHAHDDDHTGHNHPIAGATSVVLDDLWAYNHVTREWREVVFNTSLPYPSGRLHHTLVAVPSPPATSGRFLLIGGFNNQTTQDGHGSHGDVWAFNIADSTWEKIEYNRTATQKTFDAKEAVEKALQAEELAAFNALKEKRLVAKRAVKRAQLIADKKKAYGERNAAREARNAQRAVLRLAREERLAAAAEVKEKEEVKEANVTTAEASLNDSAAVAGDDEHEECHEGDADCEEEGDAEHHNDGSNTATAAVAANSTAVEQKDATPTNITNTTVGDHDDEYEDEEEEEAEEPEIEADEAAEPALPENDDDLLTAADLALLARLPDDVPAYRPPRTRTLFPTARGAHEAVLGPDGASVIMFGGHSKAFSEPSGELWRFKLSDRSWEELTPRNETFPHTPSRRVGFSMTSVPSASAIYLFGGTCPQGAPTEVGGQCADTWKLTINTNSTKSGGGDASEGVTTNASIPSFATATWSFINTTMDASYSAKDAAAPRYTPKARRAGHSQVLIDDTTVFMFGGMFMDNQNAAAGNYLFNDLWTFGADATAEEELDDQNPQSKAKATVSDLETRRWMPVNPNYGRGPLPRPTFGHSIVAIPCRDQVAMLKNMSSSTSSPPPPHHCGDGTKGGASIIVFGGRRDSVHHLGSNEMWEFKVGGGSQ